MICSFKSSAPSAERDAEIEDEVDAWVLDALAGFVSDPPAGCACEFGSAFDPASVLDRDAEAAPGVAPK
jgi:hypothetical protein